MNKIELENLDSEIQTYVEAFYNDETQDNEFNTKQDKITDVYDEEQFSQSSYNEVEEQLEGENSYNSDYSSIIHYKISKDQIDQKNKAVSEQQAQKQQKDDGKTTTTFTLFGGAIGASLLSISYIEARIGWVLYLLLLILSGVIACGSYYFENNVTHYSQQTSYRGLTEVVSNKGLSLALDIFNYINSLGIITAYISIGSNAISDFILYLNSELPVKKYKFVIKLIMSLVIDFPLTLLNKLTALSKVAAFGSFAIILTAVSIFAYFFVGLKNKSVCNDIPYDFSAFSKGQSAGKLILYFLMYVPSMQTSVTLHNTLPSLYHEILGPKVIRKQIMQIATLITMILAILVYALAGFTGGMTFGRDYITDNIIQTYSQCKFLYTQILFLVYACVVIIAFPLILFPVKQSFLQLIKVDVKTRRGFWISFTVSFVFCGLGCLIACLLESIVQIFGLFSSFAGFIIFFVVPALLYQKAEKLQHENSKYDHEEYDDVEVDSLAVAVGALISGSVNQDTISRIRAVSRSFGQKEIEVSDQNEQSQPRRKSSRATSVTQKRSILMQQVQCATEEVDNNVNSPQLEDDKNEEILQEQPKQIEEQKQNALVKNQLDELSISEEQKDKSDKETVEQQDDKKDNKSEKSETEQKEVYPVSRKRKILSWTYISVMFVICVIGIVMNTIDVVNSFKK